MRVKLILTSLMTIISLSVFSSDTLVYQPIYENLMQFIKKVDAENEQNLFMKDAELKIWWNQLINYKKADVITEKYMFIDKASAFSDALSFKAYYNQNFETGIGDDEDITYRRRMFAGLELELFKNGLLTGKIEKQRNKQKEIIENIKYERLTLNSKVLLWQDYIYKYSNSFVRRKLLLKAEIIDKLYSAYKLLSYEYKVPRAEVLRKKAELLEINNKIESLGNVDYSSELKALPFIDISVDSLLSHNYNDRDDELLKSQIELLKNDRRMISQWSLRPNLRYNFLERDGTSGNAKYGSAGFFLSIPFRSFTNRKKLTEVEIKLLKEENIRRKESSEIKIVTLLKNNYDYKERLVATINNYNITDRRIESIKNRRTINPERFNAVSYLELLADKVSQEIDMLELNRNIYINVLSITKELNGLNPVHFTKRVSYNNQFKSFAGNRYVYVWSDFVGKVPANILLAYLKEYEIGSVIISMGNIPKEVFSDYINKLSKSGINVYALIGSNKILSEERHEITSTINNLCSLDIKGINLDIEPHVFDDWDTKKDFYYGKMLNVYTQVSDIVRKSGKELHASLPVYYNQDFLRKLNPLVDRVFLMAYGTMKSELILKRIKEEMFVFGTEKTVIAYRPTDFSNAISRETLINNIIDNTHCEGVAFHKASSLFKLVIRKQ